MISRNSLLISLYVVLWLALADLVIGRVFAPAGGRVSELQRYFEYGRSVEGKLAQMMSGERDGRIVEAGWIDEATLRRQPAERAPATNLLLSAYGQSFTFNAVNRVAEMDRGMTLRLAGGPGAPASHSYRTYMVDTSLRKADAVVFGVLSSTVGQMASISGLISMYGNPAPFTYPRYRLVGDRLEEELPVIASEAAFREAFSTRSAKWQSFRDQLSSSDKGFDRFTFDESWVDASVIGRLLRRGWVAHKDSYDKGVYTPEHGFDPDSEEVRVLARLLIEADAMARSRGERFIVLLLHTKGHGAQLHQVLRGTLERHRIEFISTHDLFSANDPGMFIPDGHYVPRANDALAEALRQRLRQQAPAR